MPNKSTTLALIGIGKWGKNYLESCKGLPGIDIGYILQKSQKSVSLTSLLKKSDIDGFIIASPTSTHYKIAKKLIANNKNVLIEKPVTDSYKSTKILYDLSKKHPKSIVMAGHIQLYDPAYRQIKKNIKYIGKIKSLEYIGLKSPKRNDVSVFWDWGVHPIYLFTDILGGRIKLKSIKPIKPDGAEITVTCKDKVEGKIKIAWTYPVKKRAFIVHGEKGNLTLKSGKKRRLTPLQNEILTFVDCLKNKTQPPSDLKQALVVAKFISNISAMVKFSKQ